MPPYLVPYENAFIRLCQGGLEQGFDMVSIKIAYDIFPIGDIGFFFDAMHAMRTSMINLFKEEEEKKNAN